MLEGEKVSFDGRLTSLQQLMQEKPGRLAFNVASEPLKLTYDGSVLVREFVDLSGAVEATTPSARALVDWLGSALPPAEGFGPFSVKGRLRAAGKSLALNDATIGLDGATATGNVSIETGGERPVVKAPARHLGTRPQQIRFRHHRPFETGEKARRPAAATGRSGRRQRYRSLSTTC